MTATLLALLAAFTLLWLLSLALRDASIVDICWGPAFLLAALVTLQLLETVTPRALTVTGLVALWAARLALHLGRRNIGHGEDPRYATWRAQHGRRWWWRSYLQVFVLQSVIAWGVGWPVHAALTSGAAFPAPTDVFGIALVLTGLACETVADWQLTSFRADPANRGRVLDRGLWRFSRHPNYFGDAVVWWGFGALALAASGGWMTLVGPAAMTFLLMRVSGVTLLERDITERRPDYARYIATTSAFVPWPPRR